MDTLPTCKAQAQESLGNTAGVAAVFRPSPGRGLSGAAASDPIAAFRAEIEQHGLRPKEIVADGQLQRCPVEGKPRGRDGAYVFHSDDPPSGWYQNFVSGKKGKWTAGRSKPMSPTEAAAFAAKVEANKARREKEEAARHKEAAARAQAEYEAARDILNVGTHPYLFRKGVKPCKGLRIDDGGCLLVPMRNHDGELCNYQTIDLSKPKGFQKLPVKGARKKGCLFPISGSRDTIYITEGLATALSVNEATGALTYVAFDAGNLATVAKIVQTLNPESRLVMAADNDTETPVNPGLATSEKAARAVGGEVALPDMGGKKCDWNDLHQAKGLEAVRMQIKESARPVVAATDEPEQIELTNTIPSEIGQGNDDGWPDPMRFDALNLPNFNPDILPELLRNYCLALSRKVQAPFELCVMAALGAIATAAQRRYVVDIGDHVEILAFYGVTVLPPGERKSGVIGPCKRPLIDWESEKAKEIADEVRRTISERVTLEKAIEARRRKAADADQDRRYELQEEINQLESDLADMEVPQIPRLLADDWTPEALVELLARGDGSLGVIEAEGGLFEILGGLYSNGMANLNAVLKAWDGEAIRVDRKGREAIGIDHPALTMCMAVQPSVVRSLANKKGFRGRGFIARFWFCLPKCLRGKRKAKGEEMPRAVEKSYAAMLHNILDDPRPIDGAGPGGRHTLTLSPEAEALRCNFFDELEKQLIPGGKFDGIADWANKCCGQTVRLAGLLHVSSEKDPMANPISGNTMRAAIHLGSVLVDHAAGAFEMLGLDDATACAQKILTWLQTDAVQLFSERDAFERVKGSFPKIDQVKAGVMALADRGYVRQKKQPARSGPGRKPSPLYEVNPVVSSSL